MATRMRNAMFVSSTMSAMAMPNLQRLVGGVLASKRISYRNMCSSDSNTFTEYENDIPRFNDQRVQTILKRITGVDVKKVFRPSRERRRAPSFRLVSEKKLKELHAHAEKVAKLRLEMPPVVEERKPINKVLYENPELKGLEQAKLVFTDISYGLRDRDRMIVVREPSGTLRLATWDERERMTQVYMPRERRKMKMPELFEDKHLPQVFSQDRHEMVLDAVCIQFDPDAADFIRVHHRVYEDLDTTAKYDLLRSTRHFGGMAYYLVRQKRIDGLLVDMIQRNLITDAEDLVVLYHIMHPQCKSALNMQEEQLKGLDIVKAYIKSDAGQTGKLELVVQSYENELPREMDTSEQATRTH